MGRGLLSRLTASSVNDARPVNELESIVEHLRALLNTRQGESPSVPDFGVVDFTDLVHNFPEAIQTLQRCIRTTVLQYEPRLKNVVVQHVRDDEVLVLKFQITAQLQNKGGKSGGAVRFETHLRAGGLVSVR
jgi:type VI secretion system protein